MKNKTKKKKEKEKEKKASLARSVLKPFRFWLVSCSHSK